MSLQPLQALLSQRVLRLGVETFAIRGVICSYRVGEEEGRDKAHMKPAHGYVRYGKSCSHTCRPRD